MAASKASVSTPMPRDLQRVLGEVEREAVGVVEREGGLAREVLARGRGCGVSSSRIDRPRSRVLRKRRLLELQGLGDQRLGADQLGIGLPHLAHQRRHEAVHQRVLGAEELRMAHGAAHDPAQHVAAALVRRQHAVGDQEGRGAQMVGDDPVRGLAVALGRDAGQRARRRRSGRGTGRCRSCRACPAGRRRCARGPCRCRSRAWAGRSRSPGSICSYCMKTRFQISMNRSPSSSGLPGGPPGSVLAVVDRRSPSTGRRGRCRPSARNCRRSGCG